MIDLTWEEKQRFVHKPMTNHPHIVTPRIFKSSTVELLERAKKLYNSDKQLTNYIVESNVGLKANHE